MALLQIPTDPTLDNYSESMTLQGASFTFLFEWNYRGSYWSLSIYDHAEAPVVQGVCIRCNVDMLEFVSAPGKPPGRLYAYDTSGAGTDPGMTDLGGRVVLLYDEV